MEIPAIWESCWPDAGHGLLRHYFEKIEVYVAKKTVFLHGLLALLCVAVDSSEEPSMKRSGQVIAVAAMASLFAGGALAGTHPSADAQNADAQNAGAQNAGAQNKASHATQEQTMWERGQVLDLIQEEMMDDAASSKPTRKQTWDRGHVLNLIEEQGVDQPNVEPGQATPQVIIYFDSTASEPGLPWGLGNTNAGRSIMLKYLEQARDSAPSS